MPTVTDAAIAALQQVRANMWPVKQQLADTISNLRAELPGGLLEDFAKLLLAAEDLDQRMRVLTLIHGF